MIRLRLASLTTLLLAAASQQVHATTLPVHGAVSATASYSDTYDFMGSTKGSIDLNRVELILNSNHRFNNGLAATAQIYAYQFAGYDKISLDYASLDYSFAPQFGIRAGRVKNAFGLYGEYQDIDAATPFVFVPMETYAPNQRTFNAAFDGAKIYGRFETTKAGAFEYQIFAGQMVSSAPEHPFWASFSPQFPMRVTGTSVGALYGAWLSWETPIEGLRVGLSDFDVPKIDGTGPMKSAADTSQAITDFRIFPNLLPPGVWDAAVATGTGSFTFDVNRTDAFVEYTRGDWQFAAQYMQFHFVTAFTFPVFGKLPSKWESDSYFLLTTWQATPRLQLGAYYAMSDSNLRHRDGAQLALVPHHRGYQKDFALAASYKVTPWWTVKAEAHAINGTQMLGGGDNGDVLNWKPRWGYYAVKSTLTF